MLPEKCCVYAGAESFPNACDAPIEKLTLDHHVSRYVTWVVERRRGSASGNNAHGQDYSHSYILRAEIYQCIDMEDSSSNDGGEIEAGAFTKTYNKKVFLAYYIRHFD